jgi:hypothetical protein
VPALNANLAFGLRRFAYLLLPEPPTPGAMVYLCYHPRAKRGGDKTRQKARQLQSCKDKLNQIFQPL